MKMGIRIVHRLFFLVKSVHQSNSLGEETVLVSADFGVQCSATSTRGKNFEESMLFACDLVLDMYMLWINGRLVPSIIFSAEPESSRKSQCE